MNLSDAKNGLVMLNERRRSVFYALVSGSVGATAGAMYNGIMAYCDDDDGGDSVEGIINSLNSGSASSGGLGALSETVSSTGSSIINLLLVFGIACFIVAFMIFGVQMALGNGQERNQSKSNILWIIVGALVFFGAASIVIWLYRMAKSFSTAEDGGEETAAAA